MKNFIEPKFRDIFTTPNKNDIFDITILGNNQYRIQFERKYLTIEILKKKDYYTFEVLKIGEISEEEIHKIYGFILLKFIPQIDKNKKYKFMNLNY